MMYYSLNLKKKRVLQLHLLKRPRNDDQPNDNEHP